jgi:hypothetical protein
MTAHQANGSSPKLIEFAGRESAGVQPMPRNDGFPPEQVEIIDAGELAARWRLPQSWVRAQSRSRVRREDRIPCVRFGRYVRFRWNSPELNQWLRKHQENV